MAYPPVVILLELQDAKIWLWVNNTVIRTWRAKHTGVAGAPLELADNIKSAFEAIEIDCVIEFGDGFEAFRDA
jgi:hypothetical protein